MTPPIRRGFTLLDAMILVVAAALSSAMVVEFNLKFTFGAILRAPGEWAVFSLPLLAVSLCPFVPMLLLIRLRNPRPPCRLLVRQPGFQGILAALFAAIALVLDHGALLRPGRTADQWAALKSVLAWSFGTRAGSFVALAWFVAAMLGRRRIEKGWIDRTGRILGWCWITLWIFDMSYGNWFGW